MIFRTHPAVSLFTKTSGLLVLCAVTVGISGCSDPQSVPQPPKATTLPINPEELLAKLGATYAKAKSYSDNSLVVERGLNRSKGQVTTVPYTRLSLIFDRPNRYAVTYSDAIPGSQGQTEYRIACDGKRVRSCVSQLPDQVHETWAPIEMTTENFVPEPELRQALLQVAIENLIPQLSLLLTKDADKPIFPRAIQMEVLPESAIDNQPCYRLALQEPEGKRVLWIDKEKMFLRRMEIPIDEQRDSIDPGKQYVSFSVDVDFNDVVFDAEFDDAAVTIDVPDGARLVRRFIASMNDPPSDQLGKPVKQFAFSDASGVPVTPTALDGKAYILDFWKTDCAPCKQHTPTLEAAYQQLKDDPGMAFYGVSVDPTAIPTDAVERTQRAWGGTFPVVRDLEKQAFGSLNIHFTPSLLLVAPDGRLQKFHIGVVDDADELVSEIRRVAAGEDLAAEARNEYAKAEEKHRANIAAAELSQSLVASKSEIAELAERKLSEKLAIEELWHSKLADLNWPGDVEIVQDAEGNLQEVLTLDGASAVVRFDAEGNKIARIELPAHGQRAHGFIRTATDSKETRWYLVSGKGWQQVFLYDENWKLVLAFPDEKHSGIGDARFVDLKSAGIPSVVVGYWGGRGVQAGTLDGQRLWVNRYLDHVIDMQNGPIASTGEQTIWCTSSRGTVVEIDAEGKAQKEMAVVGTTMVTLEPLAEDDTPRCGIGQDAAGQWALVSFDGEENVVWMYELPAGTYEDATAKILPLDLPQQDRCRVVCAPNGSIHFVSPQGELIDRFDYGEAIAGYAAMPTTSGAILCVSAGGRLTVWKLASEVVSAETALGDGAP